MRFKVQCADRETGVDHEFEMDAPTVQDARRRTNEAGYLVGSIVPLTSESDDATIRTPSESPIPTVEPAQPGQSRDPLADNTVAVIVALMGSIGGPLLGYASLGCVGLVVGIVLGISLAAVTFGFYMATPERRKAIAIPSAVAAVVFIVICLCIGIPVANWWNNLWSAKPHKWQSAETTHRATDEEAEKLLQRFGAGTVTEADKALRAVGEDPDKISYDKRQKIQKTIENLDRNLKDK